MRTNMLRQGIVYAVVIIIYFPMIMWNQLTDSDNSTSCIVQVSNMDTKEAIIKCHTPDLQNDTEFVPNFFNITNNIIVTLQLRCTTSKPSKLFGRYLQDIFAGKAKQEFQLFIEMCNLGKLADDAVSGMDKLQTLSLVNCGIIQLEPQSLCSLPTLEVLFLDHNNISYIPPNLFQNLTYLKALYLQSNSIQNIQQETFKGLSSLEELYLWDNHIEHIEPCAFQLATPTIQILTLHGNNLRIISNDTLCSLPRLWSLSLSVNNISYIGPDAFQRTPNLKKLYLTKNKIMNFENGTFCNLPKLHLLSVLNNTLRQLNADMFCKPTSLMKLHISGNNINTIQTGFFNKMPYLNHLAMTSNPIGKITKDLTLGLNFVMILHMNNCSVKYIAPHIFKDMDDLLTLSLQDNFILLINSQTFIGLGGSLQQLYLSNNLIRYLEPGTFKPLRYLKHLDLSKNMIQILTTELFNNKMVFPVIMDFSSNKIHTINSKVFYDMNVALELNLENNQLPRLLSSACSAKVTSNQRMLKLGNNSLLCDCTMRWMKNSDELTLTGLSIDRPDLIQCLTKYFAIESLRQEKLLNVRFEMFFCQVKYFSVPISLSTNANNNDKSASLSHESRINSFLIKNYTCPRGCVCHDNKLYDSNVGEHLELMECFKNVNITDLNFPLSPNLTHLLINHNHLTKVKSSYFQNTVNLTHICLSHNQIILIEDHAFIPLQNLLVLDVSYNKLTKISEHTFSGLCHLYKLFLQNNVISDIHDNAFVVLKHLKEMDLSGNDLVKLHYEMFTVNNHLRFLKLGFNPWNCDCAFGSPFYKWVSKTVYVQDIWNITCSTKARGEGYGYCDTILFICLISSLGFFTIVTIAAFAIYYYRETIQIILFIRFRLRIFKYKEKMKRFDAFLSFCSDDGGDKVLEIITKLAKPPQCHKICMHYKDWLAGVMISENIIMSVKHSRRAIVLLSANYVASPWCMFEFQVAHKQFLEDKSYRLLVVLVDGAVPETDDITLKQYLITHTYLDWNSEYFWDNLRYAMPENGLLHQEPQEQQALIAL